MIAARIQEICGRMGEQTPVLMNPATAVTYGELLARATALAADFERRGPSTNSVNAPSPIVVSRSGLADFLVDVVAADTAGVNVILCPSSVGPATVEPVGDAGGGGEPRVTILTSGTSGTPKPAHHTWRTLAASVRYDEALVGARWLMAYDPARYAGLQVLLQALLSQGVLVSPENLWGGGSPATGASGLPPADAVWNALIQCGVQFASGTPTFWRMVLHAAPPGAKVDVPLSQITLGGEAVDQGLLDALAARFPRARISHIYASTEMGVCFSVRDGRAGFPTEYLQPGALPRCHLRVADDGELWILPNPQSAAKNFFRQPATGNAAEDDWFATGDLVRVEGGRVFFSGRKSDTINVGGVKVQPVDVEAVIREVDGVAEVCVFGASSSITGQLVAADVCPVPGVDEDALRRKILSHCRARLPRAMAPAILQLKREIAADPTGKIGRRSG